MEILSESINFLVSLYFTIFMVKCGDIATRDNWIDLSYLNIKIPVFVQEKLSYTDKSIHFRSK